MFWSAARQWAEHAVAAGLLTINDLKIDPGAACTLVGHNEQPSLFPDMGHADPARPDSSTRFVVEIPRSIIEALIFLHRYLPFDQRHDLHEILIALGRLGCKPTITRIGRAWPR